MSDNSDINILTPVNVEYCQHCGMPYDFCDFGDKWSTGICLEECSKRYPELFPIDSISLEQLTLTKPKKKPVKEVPKEITLQRSTRSKRKVITTVTGLQLFGVKLDVACKLFSKQFATGATVVKGVTNQLDKIDVQGDVEDAIVNVILTNFPDVTSDKITKLPPKLK